MKPGDSSAREQAASCQKVLGGWANIANEYATSVTTRTLSTEVCFRLSFRRGRFHSRIWIICLPDIRKAVEEKQSEITAYVVKGSELKEFKLGLGAMTDDEREIILKGCLINYYRG